MATKMEVRFSWHVFNGRYYPSCECVGDVDGYPYLSYLLTDDGGLGLDHHIPWLQKGKKMCENVLERISDSECVTTELFAADISADGVWISSITEEPTSGVKFRLAGINHVLDGWIEFLGAGVKCDGVPVSIHVDL